MDSKHCRVEDLSQIRIETLNVHDEQLYRMNLGLHWKSSPVVQYSSGHTANS